MTDYRPAAATNVKAIIGLVLSIISFLGLGLLGSIPGVILGRIARREIAQNGEQGDGLARAAIIVGWVSIALSILGVLAFILLILVGGGIHGAVQHQGQMTSDCIAHAESAACSMR